MDGESERDIEDIESEIGTGGDTRTGLDTVDRLLFVADIETEHTER